MTKQFQKIFIANRGEIACRTIRTCREMGIQSVVGYSECDRLSKHVQMAEEAVFLGGSVAAESYLDGSKIIRAALDSGCDAVYPGYGFLAEKADFAEACEKAGLAFIGPSSEVIRVMGDKEETRRTFQKHGIPIVPGLEDIQNVQDIRDFGNQVGWPVLLKAAAGGGGKGMKLLFGPEEVEEGYASTRSIATKAFGDSRVYVEKYISNGRHIEFQFMGDMHGNAIHFGERECSIQRNHQKLIEEAPSSILTDALRKKMGDLVVNAVQKIGYVTAGTMEFIYSNEGDLYAIEVNTRIQVEHTVTEMVYGVDLIRLMIECKEGKKLTLQQKDIQPKGHALECRINSEDPKKGFVPNAGKITSLQEPSGPFVRVDSGVYAGWEVPVFYDSMLAKLAVWAETREEAIVRMKRALQEYKVGGVKTTIPLHQNILKQPSFLSGKYDTTFIPSHFDEIMDYEESSDEVQKIALLLAKNTALGKNPYCF